ncbi:unnamed protein product, partial [Closterium sp. Yama58-4]
PGSIIASPSPPNASPAPPSSPVTSNPQPGGLSTAAIAGIAAVSVLLLLVLVGALVWWRGYKKGGAEGAATAVKESKDVLLRDID